MRWVGRMARVRPVAKREVLAERLDQLVDSFDITHLSPDPLEIVREIRDPFDQETIGLIAAAFAYGRADIVVRNVRWIVERLGPEPTLWLRDEFTRAKARRRFAGFSHRFHKTEDLIAMMAGIAATLRREGSLQGLFRRCYKPEAEEISEALSRFVRTIIGRVRNAPDSLRYLLTDPDDGSACKRMNLYLRWMVRTEEPDLGLWTFVDEAKLIMPVDTHVHRIGTFLGLIERKSADMTTARQLTQVFRKMAPEDPVRYDYALCRLGVLSMCSRKRTAEQCARCLLNDVCRFPAVPEE